MKLLTNINKLSGVAALVAAAVLLSTASTGRAQATPLYNAAATTAVVETGVDHYLQLLNPAQGAGSYTINSFQLGLNFTTTDDFGVIVTFYTGLNTSNTATDVLANAISLGGVNGTATPPTAASYTYTFTLNSPLTITIPAGGIGVEVQVTDSSFSTYSTTANGRFTASAPTVGTSPGYVWNDANFDGTFTGAEKTTFGLAAANIRFALTGSAPVNVPEPGTWAFLMSGGLGLLLVVSRRRA